MNEKLNFLKEQGVNPELIGQVEAFARQYEVPEEERDRMTRPMIPYYGKEILEEAIAAIVQGENLLLCGSKATGKNVLAENLAWIFERPLYNVSFHVNTDSSSLIGTDTFRDNEVQLRRGPVCRCAQCGAFGVLDEINMAKNDAVSVLHAVLDHRKVIDIPGYEKIDLHPATRFIATMNYGYAGTRELNEALVSRFLVIDMPPIGRDTLRKIFHVTFPDGKEEAMEQFAGLFLDLQEKAFNGEITTRSLDLRGLLAAMKTIRSGLSPLQAVKMGIINKTFDSFEKELIADVVMTRIPESWTAAEVFEPIRTAKGQGEHA